MIGETSVKRTSVKHLEILNSLILESLHVRDTISQYVLNKVHNLTLKIKKFRLGC